jgi:hypothetical protein
MAQAEANQGALNRASNKKTIVRLVALAASLHFTAVFAMSLMGAAGTLSSFDSNGVVLVDAVGYRSEAITLAQILRLRGATEWVSYPAPFHTRLYSLSFLLDPWKDFSILSAEPANLLVYLSIIVLVFKIGEEACDRRAGTLAAGIVAFWPSIFLHTTQPLKEPQLIIAILLIVLLSVRGLRREYSWKEGLATSAAGGAALVLIWLIRGKMWELIAAVVLMGTGMLLVRQVRERRVLAGNLLGAVLLVALVAIIPVAVPKIRWLPEAPGTVNEPANAQPGMIGAGLPARIKWVRHAYATDYPQAGSNIDTNVEFKSTADILRYLPRAAAIGFFAPFPDNWFVRGTLMGLKGRLLSGFETGSTYLIQLLAIVSLWKRRGQLSAWLLVAISAMAVTSLGLVIANLSVLYRMRYAYWMLLIILGADGAVQIFSPSSRSHGAEIEISPVAATEVKVAAC